MSLVKMTSKESGLPLYVETKKVVLVVATPDGNSELVFDSGFATVVEESADLVADHFPEE